MPLPRFPLIGRRVVMVDPVVDPRVAAVLAALELLPEYETLGVLPRPVLRTRPRVPVVVPRVLLVVGCARFLASSSAFRAAASRCLCSSCSRLSAACCFRIASFSMSATSCVAPCQFGLRISRWLCSVWERIRVQVLSRVAAELTVRETVYSPLQVRLVLGHKKSDLEKCSIHPYFLWPGRG